MSLREIGKTPDGSAIFIEINGVETPLGCIMPFILVVAVIGLPAIVVIGLPVAAVLEYRENEAIKKGFALEKMEGEEDPRVPSDIEDYSILPGGSSLVYSRQVVRIDESPIIGMNYYFSETAPYRILLRDLGSGKEKAIGIPIESKKESSRRAPRDSQNVLSELRRMSLVAPLFSPDEKRVAFASSFIPGGSIGIHVIERDGSEMGRVKEIISRRGIGTGVFGWVSKNELFAWTHSRTNADFFDPFVYAEGKTYLVNVDGVKEGKKDRFYFAEIEKPGYVPTEAIRAKYVTSGLVRLITRDLSRTTERIDERILVRDYRFRKKDQGDTKSPSETIGQVIIRKGEIDHRWPNQISRTYAEDLLSRRSPENLHYESKLADWIRRNPQFVVDHFHSTLDSTMLASSRRQSVSLELTVDDYSKAGNTTTVAAYVAHGDRRKRLCYGFIFRSSDNGESWEVQHRIPANEIGALNFFRFLKPFRPKD